MNEKGLSREALKHIKEFALPLASYLQDAMEVNWPVTRNGEASQVTLHIVHDPEFMPEAYHLDIRNDSIIIRSGDRPGAFYALQTLKQICNSQSDSLTYGLSIQDHPDFARRGYMLDISRDKVPTMKSLYRLIDLLASLKYNELQLYTEHTFAYKDHREVWEDASPMTPEQIRELDQYCKARNIDLVPNQNSFGHMERWLEHETYLPLAECPEDCNTIWGARKRTALDPTNPGSLELMKNLYTELLPNFSSDRFNIGCDETVELGLGRSAAEARKKGKGRVYLDYLKKLHQAATAQGKSVQFWGDIILNHPELIPELPKDITALVWGYSADHPYNTELPKFREAGISYYVCPGTSSWRSLIGRNPNSFDNLKNAAINGAKNGAEGYLLTDWGDHGHWQPAVISLPAMALGSSLAWNTQDDPEELLADWMDDHLFRDATHRFSRALLKLGAAYTKTNIPPGNANIFHLMLHRHAWTLSGNYQTREMTKGGLEAGREEILQALELLETSNPESHEGFLLKQEIKQAAALALHTIKLGLLRLEAKDGATANIPVASREALAAELEALIANHKALWLERNRPGGLEDSVEKLEAVINTYRQ